MKRVHKDVFLVWGAICQTTEYLDKYGSHVLSASEFSGGVWKQWPVAVSRDLVTRQDLTHPSCGGRIFLQFLDRRPEVVPE